MTNQTPYTIKHNGWLKFIILVVIKDVLSFFNLYWHTLYSSYFHYLVKLMSGVRLMCMYVRSKNKDWCMKQFLKFVWHHYFVFFPDVIFKNSVCNYHENFESNYLKFSLFYFAIFFNNTNFMSFHLFSTDYTMLKVHLELIW